MTEQDLAMIIIGMCVAVFGTLCVDRAKIWKQERAQWLDDRRAAWDFD